MSFTADCLNQQQFTVSGESISKLFVTSVSPVLCETTPLGVTSPTKASAKTKEVSLECVA